MNRSQQVDVNLGEIAEHGAVSWRRPPPGWIKVNIDAAIFQSTNSMGFGMLARSADGYFLGARSISILGCYDSFTAEAMGVRKALRWVMNMGWDIFFYKQSQFY